MSDSSVVRGLGWPASVGDVADGDAAGEGRNELGWPLTRGIDEPARGRSNLEREEPVSKSDGATESGSTMDVQTASELSDFNVSGPLGELDTPIAREAAVALMAAGRRATPMPKPRQTRVMVVANQKGGVGKTTSAVNLAAAMAVSGLRVLVIDLDPQGNASTALGIDHHAEMPSVYDALVDETPLSEVTHKVDDFDNLWCVPATIDLAGAEIELVSIAARESRVHDALKRHFASGEPTYDYILIDCPPSLGLLTVNALVGGDEVLIPIQCEYYALEGLSQLLKNIDMVRAHLNPELVVSTIMLTMYDGRTRLAAQVADEVRQHFGDTVLRTLIPRSVRISEAPSYGQTVLTYDAASSGAMSYVEAAREIAEGAVGSENGQGESVDG